MVTVFPKDVIKTEFELRARRSQRECNAFKLAVVGEVSCGKLSLQASPVALRHPGAKRGAELVLSPCYASRAFSERWVYFFHLHPNLVKDGPKPTALNQSWVSDISCLLTRQGLGYLSLFTGCFSPAHCQPLRPRQLAYGRLLGRPVPSRARGRPGRHPVYSLFWGRTLWGSQYASDTPTRRRRKRSDCAAR